jgi:hypothetical protein
MTTPIVVRDMTIISGDDNTFTTLTGDSAIIVLLTGNGDNAMGNVTFNSVAVTEVVEISSGGGATDKRQWIGYLLNPDIGAYTLSNGDGTQSSQAVIFVQTGILLAGQPRDSDASASQVNDVLTANLTGLDVGDLCAYAASKQGGGSWQTTEDVNSGSYAYEIADAASENAAYGDVGQDSRMSIAGAAFKVAVPKTTIAGVIG